MRVEVGPPVVDVEPANRSARVDPLRDTVWMDTPVLVGIVGTIGAILGGGLTTLGAGVSSKTSARVSAQQIEAAAREHAEQRNHDVTIDRRHREHALQDAWRVERKRAHEELISLLDEQNTGWSLEVGHFVMFLGLPERRVERNLLISSKAISDAAAKVDMVAGEEARRAAHEAIKLTAIWDELHWSTVGAEVDLSERVGKARRACVTNVADVFSVNGWTPHRDPGIPRT